MPPSDELRVKVQTPAAVVWEGAASAVSSVNEVGPFDVLPDHSNMITLVESPIMVVTTGGEKTFDFAKAVIFVRDNAVSIYADIVSDSGGDTPKSASSSLPTAPAH